MKRIIPTLSLFALLFIACDNEDLEIRTVTEQDKLEIEQATDEVEEKKSDKPEEFPETIPPTIVPLIDCNFNLESLSPNTETIINCILDLKGKTINLPANTTLLQEGDAKLFNGKLIFNSGKIDGSLLNADLKIEGTVELAEKEYIFSAKKWNITEGKTTVEIALQNKNNIQKAIDLTKKLNADTFSIDQMDAYFEIGRDKWTDNKGYDQMAINLPSNFNLKMTKNTFLRVQPSYWPRGFLLSIYAKNMVNVTGGNLIGDRFEHDYREIFDEAGISRITHEFPVLMSIAGSKNIIITDVNIKNSTGDGINFSASDGFRFVPGNPFNENVTAIGCTIDACRRNNISVTDGKDLFITNCTITNAGDINTKKGSNGWLGTNPRVGIDIEPFRGRKPDGSDTFEITENVQISGCKFRNNQVASIVEFSGDNTTMSNNNSDRGFFASFSTGAKFLNNIFVANERGKSEAAITTGDLIVDINGKDTQLSTGTIVERNIVRGFNIGVIVRGNNALISGNNFNTRLYGIQVKRASGAILQNNTSNSSSQNSIGLSIANTFAENLTLTNENYNHPRKPVELINVNTTSPYNSSFITFDQSKFKSNSNFDLFFKDTPNVTVKNSRLTNTKITTQNTINFKEINNITITQF